MVKYYDLVNFSIKRKNASSITFKSKNHAIRIEPEPEIIGIIFKNGKTIYRSSLQHNLDKDGKIWVSISGKKIYLDEIIYQINDKTTAVAISSRPEFNQLKETDFKNGEIDLHLYCSEIPASRYYLNRELSIRSAPLKLSNGYGPSLRQGKVLKPMLNSSKKMVVKLTGFGEIELEKIMANMPKKIEISQT
jgi:hypothetical protein